MTRSIMEKIITVYVSLIALVWIVSSRDYRCIAKIIVAILR